VCRRLGSSPSWPERWPTTASVTRAGRTSSQQKRLMQPGSAKRADNAVAAPRPRGFVYLLKSGRYYKVGTQVTWLGVGTTSRSSSRKGRARTPMIRLASSDTGISGSRAVTCSRAGEIHLRCDGTLIRSPLPPVVVGTEEVIAAPRLREQVTSRLNHGTTPSHAAMQLPSLDPWLG
jgi:hypothetical protein